MRFKKLCALLLAVVLTLGLCSCSIGKKGKYEKAVDAVRNGRYQEAIESLESLDGYEDSAKYITYARALQAGDSGDYETAIKALEALNGFEKSAVYITSYTTLAYEAEQARMKNVYNQAIADVKSGNYDAAIAAFETLNDYEDSGKYIAYARALQAGDSGDYETAIKALEALNGFEKSAVYITSYTTLAYEAEQARMKSVYNQAAADVKAGNYDAAIAAFETLNDYEDSGKYIMYARCLKTGDSGDYDTAIKSLTSMGDFKEAAMYIKYYTALAYEADESYEKAAAVYDEILLFKDVQTRVAALPDKILDRELERAIFWFGTEDHRYLSKLEDLLRKKYSTSDTLMYEKVMAYASQWREQKNYEPAVEAYTLLVGRGYRKAESALQETAYDYANALMSNGQYADASNVINERLSGYKDSAELLNECSYQLALEMEAGGAQNAQAAYDVFKVLGAYKDSAERVAAYETKYSDAVSKEKAGEFDAAIALFTELGTFSNSSEWITETQNAKAYAAAASLMASEKYEEAIEAFKALNGYSDSVTKISECNTAILEREYQKALKLMTDEKYEEAIKAFEVLNNYSDSATKISECNTAILEREYQKALKLMMDEKYEESIKAFEALNGYSDSATKISECNAAILEREYQKALKLMNEEKYEDAIKAFKALNGYGDSTTKISECKTAILEREYQKALKLMTDEKYEEAIKAFEALNGYSDSATKISECKTAILERGYQKATRLMEDEKYEDAIQAFEALNSYSDSTTKISECKTAILEKEYQKALKLMMDEKYEEAIKAFEALNGYSDSTTKISECKTAILEREYQKALKLMTEEKYEEAIRAFKALNGYGDSATQIKECAYRKAEKLRKNDRYTDAYNEYLTISDYKNVSETLRDKNFLKEVFKEVFSAGTYLAFGSYPQTKTGNDDTPIEWLILESDGETALLISRYALDCKPYNKNKDTTWETCTLRGWLNDEFFNKAFSADEKKSILQSDVSADKNPEYNVNPGNATKDKVFLLSVVEANKYFKSNDARMCAPTDYAIQRGEWGPYESRNVCRWWLRSPGCISNCAAYVYTDGSIYNYYVYISGYAVRPCVRVRLL